MLKALLPTHLYLFSMCVNVSIAVTSSSGCYLGGVNSSRKVRKMAKCQGIERKKEGGGGGELAVVITEKVTENEILRYY